MRAVFLVPMLCLATCLAACSKPVTTGNTEVDINGAADRARGDITSYNETGNAVADSGVATNGAVPPATGDERPLAPAAPGQPGGLPDDRTPAAEGKFAPDSAQGAANVVQIYYASIEGGKYAAARALWGNGGADSKLSPAAFAASFAKYKEYHANIGGPGEIEGAAGSRYVTVPVQIYARLKDGRPDYRTGNVVLRRTEVDGATPEQRKWHIYSIDLKPAPGKAEYDRSRLQKQIDGIKNNPEVVRPPVISARYRCMDGTKFAVRFDNRADTAQISRAGKMLATLDGQKPASGIWYRKGPYELRGKGDAATLTTPGHPPIACTVIR
ncbi:MAG: MliC family protein [Sphingomonas sp.]|uniref:MliC family protein n=1 Tax=Sphingomonas sp. TaxID=28214 RepID=UPI003F81DD76